MKKTLILFIVAILLFSCAACEKNEKEATNMEPKSSQMKAICELAVMDCYYHNVAKYKQNLETFWPWEPDIKHFWIEYSGVVKLGVDISLVKIEVEDTTITITMPEAKVLGCKVDSATLTKESFVVAKDSADITAEDEIKAFGEAQKKLEETAANDKALLASAQQRAMELLEDYVTNIGNTIGKEYSIRWIYVDDEGNQTGTSSAINNSVDETSG